MSWFRKRKVEVIDLKIIDNKNNNDVDISHFYSEKNDYEKEGFITSSIDIKKEIIDLGYKKVKKSNYELINEYLLCKIFSKVVLKDKDFNKNIEALDIHIQKVKKEYEQLQKVMNDFHDNIIDENTYLEVYDKIRSIEAFNRNIKDILLEVKNQHFNLLKIATVNVCLNKSNQDLEILYENLNNFLNDYKNLKEASEYIFYNSGSVILDVVETIISRVSKSKNKEHLKTYDINYFLKSDVVITLDYSEWIELFNKIKFTIKIISDGSLDKDKQLKDKFNAFEMRYLILMMNLETNSKPKKL